MANDFELWEEATLLLEVAQICPASVRTRIGLARRGTGRRETRKWILLEPGQLKVPYDLTLSLLSYSSSHPSVRD